ncbi:MAG: 16S rRNA (guanine(527)-N(7))-methyltransferase RsmG [Gammaproteobacteria bacterium]|nr:16S rRNA (guanine(527)-N(7))-methyltransferase RsmG [Gammaproteobacteria bacterium]
MDAAARLDWGLERLGLPLSGAARDLLLDYVALLARWNRAFNLTAVREPEAMVSRHILDSLTLVPHVHGASLLDVGTGAGLPGMVVAAACPGLAVTLLDANGKKTRFCRQAVAQLGLANVTVVHLRVEGFRPPAGFDTVVSRAFRDQERFLAACERLAAPGGRLVAMAGRRVDGWRGAVHAVAVPGVSEARHIVVVERRAAGFVREGGASGRV